jgi:hypothetical protein
MKIGSTVECINDAGINPIGICTAPKKGKLYTVTGFVKKPRGMGIYIEECPEIIPVGYPNNRTTLERVPFLMSRFVEVLPPMKVKVEEYNFQTI